MNSEHSPARVSAHLSLPQIGVEGQRRISRASVFLLGLGGLGCAVAPYLAAAGVARLSLCDFDTVVESNLARQLLFGPGDLGRRKAETAAERLRDLNPEVDIQVISERADHARLPTWLDQHDLAVDASDNYGTRLVMNQACLARGLPWVMGACVRMEGQLAQFEAGERSSPCYRCAYGSSPEHLEDCPGAGVFSTVAGVTGTAMAHLALARLAGHSFAPALHLFDGSRFRWQSLLLKRNPACEACAENRG